MSVTRCGRRPKADRRDASRTPAARPRCASPRSALAVASGVTYRQQHDFLIKRVNRRARERGVANPSLQDDLPRLGDDWVSHPRASAARHVRGRALHGRLGNGHVSTANNPPDAARRSRERLLHACTTPHYRVSSRTPDSRARLVGGRSSSRSRCTTSTQTLHHLLFVEILVARRVLLALALLALVGREARPPAAASKWRRPRARSRRATCRSASRSIDEHTEVGRLGVAFNEMLAQIEHRVRRERLRPRTGSGASSPTPRTSCAHRSTSIRGYAELFRRGAAERPDDLAKAMRRIEEEASRMGVLVDDLLLLARLDQGRPLERASGRSHTPDARCRRRCAHGRAEPPHRLHARRRGRDPGRRAAPSPGARQPAHQREPLHAARRAGARAAAR